MESAVVSQAPVFAELTARQREIYEYIRGFVEEVGYPPSVRELGEQFKIRSPNGVICHLRALERKGYIIRNSKLSRAITVVEEQLPDVDIVFDQLKDECERLRVENEQLRQQLEHSKIT